MLVCGRCGPTVRGGPGHPTGYLILDDSIHVKPKGRKMGGLGRHYANSEGRVVARHCLFTGLYVLCAQRSPLPMQMYSQRAVCEQEDVPFRSKIDMAVGPYMLILCQPGFANWDLLCC